jgi:hypothetical protein
MTAAAVADQHRRLKRGIYDVPTSAEAFTTAMIVVAFAVAEGAPVVEATPALLEMLEHTDIENSVAAEQLRMPMPRSLYLHMPRSIEEYPLYDGEGGHFPLEGVLIRESRPLDPNTGLADRWLELVIASSISAKSQNALDDAYFYRPIAIGPKDESKSVMELIRDYDIEMYAALGLATTQPGSPEAANEAVIRRVVSLATKALLYLNMPDARRVERPDRTELMKLPAPANPVKRRKYDQRLRGSYDRIVVGPTWEEAGMGGTGSSAARRAHLRRGHFRNQAHGQGMALRRLVWIRPTVVGAHEGETVRARDYTLK